MWWRKSYSYLCAYPCVTSRTNWIFSLRFSRASYSVSLLRIAAEDDRIDELFYKTWLELIGMIIEDPTIINNASHLLFTLRYLERIGDHASNICESVVYMVTAERVERDYGIVPRL
ncbi:MAG TPA: hypothetical protein C5S51_01820 [Methanosarcinaceae archaeon]|nr:hypothetical protein [Methanosarcinaceae archaeon]